MPNGSLVAGFQKREVPGGKISKEIAFWEKNGLRHGDFVLPDQTLNVVHIEINIDSALMALLCISDDQSQVSILVCARSNWQWQVKQKLGPLDFKETNGIWALKWMT